MNEMAAIGILPICETITSMGSRLIFIILVGVFSLLSFSLPAASLHETNLLRAPIYLSIGGPEWSYFENQKSAGTNLSLPFTFDPEACPCVLSFDQEDVKQNWKVDLNGRKIGELFLMENRLVSQLEIPQTFLKPGTNILSVSVTQRDDILLHQITLSSKKVMDDSIGLLELEAKEKGKPIPVRITITSDGILRPVTVATNPLVAVRPGVVYSALPKTQITLQEGAYTVHVSRGPEYSVSTNQLNVKRGETNKISADLDKVVNTSDLISTDTHIHTLTFSRHGDATLDERLVTLAAEGLKMPISTEHNQHSSYAERARELGLDKFFKAVTGNEVTTKQGHFNCFPVSAKGQPANHNLTNWVQLISDIREVQGVQMVTLNHPCDVHSGFRPFAGTNFNRATGRNLRGDDFSFDAMEIINSGAMRSDWMEPFRGWFGLLNRGLKVVGVAGSDSHDVSRFIVGQGRTYIIHKDAETDFDPTSAIKNLHAGRAIASLGLIPRIAVDGSYTSGDLVKADKKPVQVTVEVTAPPWLQVTNISLFKNGYQVRGLSRSTSIQRDGQSYRQAFELEPGAFDFHLVAIATGPGITAPYWALARPYQPSSKTFVPMVIGATNPVFIDADTDGKWNSPRSYARKLLSEEGSDEALNKVAKYDRAVAAQLAELLVEARELDSQKFKSERFGSMPEEIRSGFADFFQALTE